MSAGLQPPRVALLLLFYAAYVAAGGFGQGLAIVPGVAITFWPPAGIFLATLLMTKPRTWPWWLLAGFLAEMTCNAVWFHNSFLIAPVYFLANALEALAAAWLLRRVASPFRLETLREVAALAVFGAGVAPLIGATIIATTDEILGKHDFMTAWPLVWLGDGSGLLISTPLTLVAVQALRERARIGPRRLGEAAVLAVLLVGIGALAFKGVLPTAYMTMPVLLWAAIRYQLRGAAAALAVVTLTTALFTVAGEGEFAGHPELLEQKIVMLQAFLGISAVSALLAAALSLQHREALRSLGKLNLELEARVVQRTATLRESEGKLALFVEHAPAAIAMFDTEMRCLACSRHFISDYGLPPADEVIGRPHDALPALPQQWRAALPNVVAGAELAREADEFRRADGRVDWIRWSMKPWRAANGRIGGALLVSELITAQVAARQALAANEQMLRLAQEAGELGAWEYDHLAKAASWSAQTRKLLDLDAETPASLVALLSRVHAEDRAHVEAQLTQPPAAGREASYDGEFRILPRDGGIRWLRHRGRIELAGGGSQLRTRGVIWDITQRKHHEEQLRLLMHEFNHRSKNMLTLVQAIARQSSGGGARDFAERFEKRILALAANQDLLMRDDGLGADLDALVRAQLKPFVDPSSARLAIAGPPVTLSPTAAQAVGMAMHELATNAVKYGSLSTAEGRIEIAWSVAEEPGMEPSFRMAWRERGGPPVARPERTGFGLTVITRMMEASLRGAVELDYRPDGLRWSIAAPLPAVGALAPEAAQQAAG